MCCGQVVRDINISYDTKAAGGSIYLAACSRAIAR